MTFHGYPCIIFFCGKTLSGFDCLWPDRLNLTRAHCPPVSSAPNAVRRPQATLTMQQSESKMMVREGSTMDRARYSPRPTDARNDHRAGIHSSEGVEDMMELMM